MHAPLGVYFDGGRVQPRCNLRLISPAVAFGDRWRICSQACRLVSAGFEVGINPIATGCIGPGGEWSETRHAGRDHSEFLEAVFAVLELGDRVTVSKNLICNARVDHEVFMKAWPSRIRWSPMEKTVAYQFDGYAVNATKNPPRIDIDRWLWDVREAGWSAENLGGGRDVLESAAVAASCQSFCGIDSGLAQLAYSVGCPVDLVLYGSHRITIRNWHGRQPRAFLRTLRAWRAIAARSAGFVV